MYHFRAVVRNKAGLNRSSNKQHESEQAKQAAANRLSKKDRKKLKKKNKKIEKTQKKNLEQQTIRKLVSFDKTSQFPVRLDHTIKQRCATIVNKYVNLGARL